MYTCLVRMQQMRMPGFVSDACEQCCIANRLLAASQTKVPPGCQGCCQACSGRMFLISSALAVLLALILFLFQRGLLSYQFKACHQHHHLQARGNFASCSCVNNNVNLATASHQYLSANSYYSVHRAGNTDVRLFCFFSISNMHACMSRPWP